MRVFVAMCALGAGGGIFLAGGAKKRPHKKGGYGGTLTHKGLEKKWKSDIIGISARESRPEK